MTKYTVYNEEDVDNTVNRDEVKVGDTIEVITDNQQGYKTYEVQLDSTGNKFAKSTDSYEFSDDEETTQTGGKRKSRKSRKTRKSKKSRKSRKGRKSRKNRKTSKKRRYH